MGQGCAASGLPSSRHTMSHKEGRSCSVFHPDGQTFSMADGARVNRFSIDPAVAFVLILYLLLLGKVVGVRQAVKRWCTGGTPTSLERHSRHAECTWPGHGSNWHHSPGASEAEQAAIEDAKARLPADALALTLGRALACGDPAFEMELLRKLRTLPSGTRDGEGLAAVMISALAWKRAHAEPAAAGGGKAPPTEGLAAADLVHGEWACRFLVMGMRCGRSLGGHPVKIERIGANDMQAAPIRTPHLRRRPLPKDRRGLTRHAHAMHTPCTRHAHAMHTPCTRHAHAMHTPCTRHAHAMHTPCTLQAPSKHRVTAPPSGERIGLPFLFRGRSDAVRNQHLACGGG